MRGSTESRSIGILIPFVLLLAFGLGGLCSAQLSDGCDWQRGQLHKMHWPQLPDLSPAGVDVSLSGATLADDFLCTATGPIRTLHIWASFADDQLPETGLESLILELSIYSDIPADGDAWSQPGRLLWSQTFQPGQYTAREVHDGPEDWYDPTTESYATDNHRKAYQYNFCVVDDPFVQEEGNVYWLAIKASSADADFSFGWKTTAPQRCWNDRAVYLPDNRSTWLPMDYPQRHRYAQTALGLAFVITSGDDTTAPHELGDAPDSSNSFTESKMTAYSDGTGGSFPTVYQAGSPPYGPIHQQPRDAFYLGTWVSLESEADLGPDDDGVNNLDPANDAANQDAADDGLQLPVVMPHERLATVDYTLTVTNPLVKQIYVNLWCDWNRDGDWNDTIITDDGTALPEWAVQDEQPAVAGLGTYTFTSASFVCWHPAGWDDLDPIWVRLMVSEESWAEGAGMSLVGGAGPADGYQYGETEDYYLQPLAERTVARYDWGDAPGYATTLAGDGARHVIAGPWLGAAGQTPDAETNGQPALGAMGDDEDGSDDEDGASIPPLVRGEAASITLSVQGGGGVVQVWIDFDADGAWYDSEEVFNGYFPDGVHIISFAVPDDAAIGQSFARLRISRSGGLDPDDGAPDGEVEDHEVRISMAPADVKWCQWPDCTPRGMDIRLDGTDDEPRVLADNFECRSSDLLTHVRLWGSWREDQKGQIETIRLRLHANDPAGWEGADKTNAFAQPRPETLWEMEFGPGQYTESLYDIVEIGGEWWWDPALGVLVPGGDTEVWQIDVEIDPDDAYLQSGSELSPRIYWLAVEVETSAGQFGWKTRHWPQHFAGDAVWNIGSKLPRVWQELRYPDGHRCCDHEDNSIDLAFCLMYTQSSPEPVTSRPTSITQCPAVETACPATETQCPPMATSCPAVETMCPMTSTTCPAVATRCPTTETQCPPTVTRCPTVETQCPTAATKCPPMATQCPATATVCQTSQTACPVVETQCPSTETKCPATVTQCPATATVCQTSQTACPVVETQCPSTETKCPATVTQCPATATMCQTSQTACPVVETQCPSTETKCPVAVTQCPTTETRCPATSTQCPVVVTRCPATETQCPATTTKCPTMKTQCPTTTTQCPTVVTQCPTCGLRTSVATTQATSIGACPTVEAPCPTVADYLAKATARK